MCFSYFVSCVKAFQQWHSLYFAKLKAMVSHGIRIYVNASRLASKDSDEVLVDVGAS